MQSPDTSHISLSTHSSRAQGIPTNIDAGIKSATCNNSGPDSRSPSVSSVSKFGNDHDYSIESKDIPSASNDNSDLVSDEVKQSHLELQSLDSAQNVVTEDTARLTGTASLQDESTSGRRESSIPSGQIARIANFAGLGIGLALGTFGELARQAVAGTLTNSGGLKSLVLNEKNSERLTLALCRMRGAALKLGQLLSIQDEHVIPRDSPLRAVIDRVREEAENMPAEQLYRVLRRELGSDWRSRLETFDDAPMAAASIGQVAGGPGSSGARRHLQLLGLGEDRLG